RRALVEAVDYPYLHPSAKAALEERREDLGPLLRGAARPVQIEAGAPGAARWWTFAGGRINHTRKYALESLSGWKVVGDNVLLRIEGDGVTRGAVDEVIDRMADERFWSDEGTWRAILARLPPYRLSKFQGVLPEAMAVELVAGHLLDAEGARGFVRAG
ncbi:MAG: DEAD/DEAH box helicase, partial [Polyangiaceae bacterium]|nr:DEAD/DEAH box helicase [Polyangiaceae bacterium]